MNRRKFLFRLATLFSGSFLGLNSLSRALACEKIVTPSRIAIIIDDIGFSLSRLQSFLDIGAPLTFAVLPKLDKTGYLTEEIYRYGHEIMLHQPMEPFDPSIDPGPGALYVRDTPDRIIRIIEENISEVPFATGINNHMGSKFTTHYEEMIETLSVIRERGLFFVDSLTTSRSMGYKAARNLHIASARRNFFLDNVRDEKAIMSQLYKLRLYALRFGYAIGIGHPFEETANAVNSFVNLLDDSNISLVHISNLIS